MGNHTRSHSRSRNTATNVTERERPAMQWTITHAVEAVGDESGTGGLDSVEGMARDDVGKPPRAHVVVERVAEVCEVHGEECAAPVPIPLEGRDDWITPPFAVFAVSESGSDCDGDGPAGCAVVCAATVETALEGECFSSSFSSFASGGPFCCCCGVRSMSRRDGEGCDAVDASFNGSTDDDDESDAALLDAKLSALSVPLVGGGDGADGDVAAAFPSHR